MTITAALPENESFPGAKTACYHCGEDCPDHPIRFGHKPFCCEGCKTVYEILNTNDLCQYYQIERSPGFSLRARRQEHYAWLDDPEVVDKLVDFTDGKTTKVTLYLPQIHCASCIWLVENLYKLSPGILASKVNFLKKEASIAFSNEQTTLRKVVELLASIGYAPEINLGSVEQEKKRPVSRRLIYQLGVAGFAFGNIMLLSFPEYFGLVGEEASFRQLFGYLNILLATPVAFFSGKDYLTAAWYSIRTRNPGIDIPLALGIVVLYFRSVFEILTNTGAGYMDSLAGLVFFLLIGKWFQQMTYHRISFDRDYKSYFPVAATKLKGRVEESVPVNKLEPGDTILVRQQELIPADGILKKGVARIDYSFVTGEAEPVERREGEKIYAGGRQFGDAIELLLTKKVSQSYLTQLWNESAFQQEKLAGASRLANKVSRYFTTIILALSFVTLAYWLPKDARIAFNAFTAVLIIACPCAAALNVPFTLGNAVRMLAKRGFFLKNTNVIEALYPINKVVFDKTGTLTHAAGSQLHYEGQPLLPEEKAMVKALARQSSHPLSRQIAAEFQAEKDLKLIDFQEFTGKGTEGRVGERKVRIGSGKFLEIASCMASWSDAKLSKTVTHPSINSKDRDAMQEVKVANGSVFIEIDGQVKGSFSVQNRYRQQLQEVVGWFRRASETYLLSGDNDRERAALQPLFEDSDAESGRRLFFQQSPKDKLDFIQNLQNNGGKVLMLGDGLNDAGALQQSDAGIVVAENVNNFTPACDAILDAKQFARLPKFLTYARKSIHLVYAAWVLAAIYNVIGLSYATQGLLSPVVAAILMPLSSVTIVGFGMLSTTVLANMVFEK